LQNTAGVGPAINRRRAPRIGADLVEPALCGRSANRQPGPNASTRDGLRHGCHVRSDLGFQREKKPASTDWSWWRKSCLSRAHSLWCVSLAFAVNACLSET